LNEPNKELIWDGTALIALFGALMGQVYMPKLNIDGTVIEVEDGITVLQACEQAGVSIPRFCYHERLSIAGNCRMCLVEVVGAPKPVASCAMGVNDLRPGKDGAPPAINTLSPLVKKARQGVMEFLLINHPLDCPICDQGGECDLQDQSMAFGGGGSRFHENKRAVEEKYLGPLIKTQMTRCIHCTRCVRFMTEIAGIEELGLMGRGEDAEIATYLEQGLMSELSANVIDLCPVGALTSRPYAFVARPWELKKTESIDVMDAIGSAIRVDTRGRDVMRILPRNNDAVNEEWISNKTRHVADGLRVQRLDQPYLREDGKLRQAGWDEALGVVAAKLQQTAPQRIGFLIGDLCAAEDMYALKALARQLGVRNIDCRQDGAQMDPALGRAGYLFNSTIEGIERADAILLIGCNPRLEAAVLNARIHKGWRQGRLRVGVIGEPNDLTYPYDYLGARPASLNDLANGQGEFASVLRGAKYPMIIVGAGAVARADGTAVLALAAKLALAVSGDRNGDGVGDGDHDRDWNAFNLLQGAASRVAGLDLGLVPENGGLDTDAMLQAASGGELDVMYLLAADEIDMGWMNDAFVIYQGSHGDRGAHRADVILPAAAYTEKSGTYVNTEGRAQMAAKASFPPGEAKEDWAIIRALSGHLGAALPFNTLPALRALMYKDVPGLAALDMLPADQDGGADGTALQALAAALAGKAGTLGDEPFSDAVQEFYLTNPIARASQVLAELSALKKALDERAGNADAGMTGTHGGQQVS